MNHLLGQFLTAYIPVGTERNKDMNREAVLENFFIVKEAGYTAARDYSPEEIKQLATRGYIVRPKGPTNTNRPNERIITHKGKRYAYDHREYTHGTGKRVGIGLGVLGAGATMLGPAPGISRALQVGAVSGGLGYVVGRKLMEHAGESGIKGLIMQKAKYDLDRIKLRRID